MSSFYFSILFVCFCMITVSLQCWLGLRHIRHISICRSDVPDEFSGQVSLQAHQKAADYTSAKTRLSILTCLVDMAVLIGFTLLGGLQWLSVMLLQWFNPGMAYQISVFMVFIGVSALIHLPFGYYKQFVIEEKFGFNKMSLSLFFTDLLKSIMIGAAIIVPLCWIALILMERAGDMWWLYTWAVWSTFQLLMMGLYPTVIAPLFNRFTPLTDELLRVRIERLMKRVGFLSKGLFVMDGSKRSAHGNAYFSGLGSAKRIVFFDTLLSQLEASEVEAVLAHELGHFKLRHITKRIGMLFVISFLFLMLLGYLRTHIWFFTGLGVDPFLLSNNHDAVTLILFFLVMPVFLFPFSPVSSAMSRKHEFEADAFAARYTKPEDLVRALVKLHQDNASTLTPDPLYSLFYDSHPSAHVRIRRLFSIR